MTTQTLYKYKVFNKQLKETHLFTKFQQVREYCGISRPQLYKIFNGATPNKWVTRYDFQSIRIPKYIQNPDLNF